MMDKTTALIKQHWPGAECAPFVVVVFLVALVVAFFSGWFLAKRKSQMTKKIAVFFKRLCLRAANMPLAVLGVVLAALVIAFLSFWIAKMIGVRHEFSQFVESVLSSTVIVSGVIAGVVVWLINKFSNEIRQLIERMPDMVGVKYKEKNIDPSIEIAEEISAIDPAGNDKNNTQAVSETKRKISDAATEYDLAVKYANGRGVERDEKKAVELFHSAAEHGYAKAQNSLGVRYAKGKGVPQDYAKAIKWFRLAAEQGFAAAQFNLGVGYAKGEGVPQSEYFTFVWYSISAVNGDPDGDKFKDIVAKHLSADDLAKAKTEAARIHEEIRRKQAENED